ncbi:MAG: TlpA disulfide reductase family protein, partial [Bacteroidota bacterium]
KDTLKVSPSTYSIFDGTEFSMMYLKNGYDLFVTFDAKKFDETISYSGTGAASSNYLAKRKAMDENIISPALFNKDEESFTAEITKIQKERMAFLEQNKEIDSVLYEIETQDVIGFQQSMLMAYKSYKQQMASRAAKYSKFNGKPAPKFDFENHKGGNTSLKDLQGKYVYIDVWATWCGPCIAEIPSLKKVEKAYHDKNIAFVSISVDDGRGFKGDAVAAKKGWKKMVTDRDLGGIQLVSDKGWKANFIQSLEINSIPRFILIDPNGEIVNADAPRPSNPQLIELFNQLKI